MSVSRDCLLTVSEYRGALREEYPAMPRPAVGQWAETTLPACCTLGPRPDSVKQARDFTRTALSRFGLVGLRDEAELVVSELVTNALRHGLSAAERTKAPAQECPIRLWLLGQAPDLMCMVTDPGAEIPVRQDSDPYTESGRGLQVVASCSRRWGWDLLDQGGKVVWALLQLDKLQARGSRAKPRRLSPAARSGSPASSMDG
jgi:hypothetical protein